MKPCTVYEGRADRDGYGRKWVDGRSRLAHRLAYESAYGPIPPRMTIDHLCFNRLCVEPAHLRLLTHAQNSANQRSEHKTRCLNGHDYSPQNTYWRTSTGGGRRDCKACIRDRVARYRANGRRAA